MASLPLGIPISLIGNVGKDGKHEIVGSDIDKLTFSLAFKRADGKDRDGEDKEATDWYDCSVWRGYAKALNGRIKKGDRLFVRGNQTINKYTDRDGKERVSMRINVEEIQWIGQWPEADASNGSSDEGNYEAPNF